MREPVEMVFGVDIDSVLGDYVAAFRASVSLLKGIDPASMAEPVVWDFVKTEGWQIKDRAEFLRLHQIAVLEHGLFLNMPAYEGASKGLWEISDAGIRIKIITHRLVANGYHGRVVSDTVSWLESKNIPFRDLCFVADKASTTAHLYVDDAPHNIAAIRATHGESSAVVFNQSYNLEFTGLRVNNWGDLTELVLNTQRSGGYYTEQRAGSLCTSWRK